MTAEKLNQEGQAIDLRKFAAGTKVYFYKPPNIGEVEKSGRKAKHLSHYVDSVQAIGSRGFVIAKKDVESGKVREYQRDAVMILLKKPLKGTLIAF